MRRRTPQSSPRSVTLDERSLHRNLGAACHSSIVHILGFFYVLPLGQITAQSSGEPLFLLRRVGLFALLVRSVWLLFGHSGYSFIIPASSQGAERAAGQFTIVMAAPSFVMAGLDAAIQRNRRMFLWMAGSGPAMTNERRGHDPMPFRILQSGNPECVRM